MLQQSLSNPCNAGITGFTPPRNPGTDPIYQRQLYELTDIIIGIGALSRNEISRRAPAAVLFKGLPVKKLAFISVG